jgi:hypothetical protein
MTMPIDTVIEKKRRRVAADYRRRGYRVTRPESGSTVPSFLRDCHPELIAERDDDRVVIEIKRSHKLRGSNDLEELAARVAAEPGWRLELVTLGRDGDEGDIVSRPDWLENMLRRPDLGGDPGQVYLHVVYLGQVLEFLIRGVALLNHIGTRDKPAARIARELVFKGVMGQPTLDRIEMALGYRNSLLHEWAAPEHQVEQVAEMTALCRDIYAECRPRTHHTWVEV